MVFICLTVFLLRLDILCGYQSFGQANRLFLVAIIAVNHQRRPQHLTHPLVGQVAICRSLMTSWVKLEPRCLLFWPNGVRKNAEMPDNIRALLHELLNWATVVTFRIWIRLHFLVEIVAF